jgi:hypothetical protein
VEKRVKRPWTDTITVVLEFPHHGYAKDGLMHGMNQYMEPNQT